jgi:predicted amidophosphoribosyltransferase
MIAAVLRAVARWVLDFALPPRCAGCGTIVADVHSFCAECWKQVEFLGDSGCSTCGLPLQAPEQRTCVLCLARPPRIARTRAAVAYDDLPRSLAIRLKYGRKVAIARTMARYMAPLVDGGADRVFVPVPLHRTRLWSRGFNQSALVARELSRRLGISVDPFVLRRIRRTPPLKGMGDPAPQDGRRGIPGIRQSRSHRKDGHPGRRCADHRQHRRGLRADPEARRCGARRADQLGACGETFAVDALSFMPKYRT